MTLSNSQSSSGNNNNSSDVLIHRTTSNSRNCGNGSGGSRRNNCDRGQNSKSSSSQYYSKTSSNESERNVRSSIMPIASACNNYSSSDMTSIDETSSDNHTKSKDTFLDERLTKSSPEQIDSAILRRESSSFIRRYTRSALYLIRNDTRSRCRPKCASKLQILCIWKAGNSNYSNSNQQNGGNNNSSTSSNSMDMSSLSSPRMNSMSRQQSNNDLLYSGNSAGVGSHHSSQKTYLDQRSISSSHLMPAFAKRRIGNFIHAICGNSTTGGGAPGSSGSGGGGGGNSGGVGSGSSLSTPNDAVKFHSPSGKNNDHKQYASPQRKNVNSNPMSKPVQNSTSNILESDRDHDRDREHDRERGRDKERERDMNLNLSNSGSSSNARERRIGSGRLLPRDVNWDYHSEKESKDSASTSSGSMPFEKDLSSHLSAGVSGGNQRTSGGNQNSRFDYSHRSPASKDRTSNSGGGGGGGGKNCSDYRTDSRYESRRTFTRGDYERDNRGDNSNYVRRFMSDLINQNTNNSFGNKSNSGGGVNHSENRRRNTRNDEPEWFSSGPTSQHDTIELRGFDEIDDSQSNSSGSGRGESKNNRGNSSKQNNRRNRGNNSQIDSHLELFANEKLDNKVAIESHDKTNASARDRAEEEKLAILTSRCTPSPKTATDANSDTNNNSKDDSISSDEKKSDEIELSLSSGRNPNKDLIKDTGEGDAKKDTNSIPPVSFVTDQGEDKTTPFNFDAFLNVDPSNLLMSEQTSGDTEVGSRFSRWFAKQGDNQKTANAESRESPRLSAMKDNMVPIMLESQLMKNEREACESANTNQSNTLMEFLQRGKINTSAGNMEPVANVGSIPSVEELEARMRKIGDDPTLLNREQSSSTANDNMNNPLNQFLNNSMQQQQQQQQQHQQQQRQKHIQQFMVKSENQTIPVQSPLNTSNLSQHNVQVNHALHNPHLNASQTQDMEAFKKLLEQITPTSMNAVKLPNQNIQQLAPPTQQQQQQIQRLPTIATQPLNILTTIGGMPPPNPAQIMKNDELTKFLQQQQLHQRRSQHVIPGPPQHPQMNQPIPNDMPMLQAVFLAPHQRLEAQLLLQGISRGEVSQTSLGHQFSNPNTSPRTKEVLAAVLRETSRDTSPNVIMSGPQIMSPVLGQSHCAPNMPQPPPPIIIPSPQQIPFNHSTPAGPQQQHPSTGTNTGCLPQRIPSPRELQYHTQSIMQNALIKKKLEEQQENFRRRQEIQKQQMQQLKPQQSPSQVEINEFNVLVGAPQQQQFTSGQHPKKGPQQPQQPQQQQQMIPNQQARHVNSPTPLAFTPTSVLRKMTAEKDSVSSFNNPSAAVTASTPSTTGTANTSPLMATTTMVASNSGGNNPNPNKSMHPLLMHYQQHQTNSQNQPRMILGVGSHSQQQQQQNIGLISGPQIQQQQQHPDNARLNPALRNNQIKWTGTIMNQISLNKPMGRPILKGNITQSMPTPNTGLNPLQPSQQSQQQPPQMTFASKIEFQQIQQQRVSNSQQPPPPHPQQKTQPPPQQQPQQQQSMPPQQQSQNMLMTQLYQQRAAIQRAQHFQFHQLHQQQQQQQHHQQQQQMNIMQNNGNRAAVDRINSNQPVSNCGNIINYQRDGGLSPTSNQLARWFSPELLAQASEGKLPPLNMNQVLSLEEFEKSIQHSSTAVNN